MSLPHQAGVGGFLNWARSRRFPTLFFITGGLFLVDLVIPDLVPFIDELLLGMATIILARWKDQRAVRRA
jgi:hypothetical protein